MAKLNLQDIANFQNESTAITAFQSNNDVTEIAMENTLSRDGLAPNQMLSNFDMNNYKIINLPNALTDQEPVTYHQLKAAQTVPLGQVIGLDIQAFDPDLSAVAGLTTTGLIIRTGAGTATTRTVTGTANEITLTNGDGVSGNPTISLPTALTFTGKTITGGTYSSPTLTTPALGSPTSVGTMPAFTLGGTVSGGGNQINNIIIGTTTPLAGSFTTLASSSGATVTQNTNAIAAGFSASNLNAGASVQIENNIAITDAGTLRIAAGSIAGAALANIQWTGSGGLFIDQKNAAGSITFRTGTTPNNVLELTTSGGAVITAPGALTTALTVTDTSASGRTWLQGPRVGTGSQDLYAFTGGTFGTILYINGVTGASIGVGAVLSQGATQGIGYATGAGGTVTQATSRTTGVTINKVSGAITLFSQVNTAVSQATAQSFTVTNSAVAATDTISVSQKSGTDKYEIFVTNVAAGSFQITNYAVAGTTNEAPVFNFNVIKGVTS